MTRRHALRIVDDALVLTRDAGARTLLRATWPSLALTWLALVAYAVERIEGVPWLRPAFAGCALGLWCARAVRLGELACRGIGRVLARDDVPLPMRPPSSVAATAGWALFPLLLLALPLVLLARNEPFWAVLGLPLLALRALYTGRLLPDATLTSAGPGLSALVRSAAELEGSRVRALAVELWLTLATLVLAFNLGAAASAIAALSQDVLGFELALVRAFLTPSNVFVTLGALGLASAFVDGVRANAAALIVAEAVERDRALPLRDAVDAALAVDRRTRALRAGSAALALCVALMGRAHADALPAPDEPSCDLACGRARAHDDELSQQVSEILARPEFRSFEVATNASSEPDWLRSVFTWIDRLARRRGLLPALPDRAQVLLLPSAWAFLALAALVTLAALLAQRRTPRPPPPPAPAPTPRERPRAHALLADALALSERDTRAAMRRVFLGMLAALSERGLLRDVARSSNAQLAASLEGSGFGAVFHAVCRDFETAVYGDTELPRERVRLHATEVRALFSFDEAP